MAHSFTDSIVSRRRLLRGAVAGAGAVALPSLLAACSSGPKRSGDSANGTVTLGSNASDPVPRKAYTDVIAGYHSSSGRTVDVRTTDHNTFQENINRYLQSRPDDVFMWFAGYRMQFFAAKGLLDDINDLWQGFTGFSQALKDQSTGQDGKQYFVPFYYYPWAVFYRKSVFQQHGYQIPKTLDEYTALAKQMQKDGLVPIALGDKDGWPAMGTFDYLNMRANGYEFHKSLMAGKEAWTDPKVKHVFDLWRGLMPYHDKGANGRTWQEAAQTLAQKKSGMAVFGLPHPGQQFAEADRGDLDFFAFPEIDPQWGQDSVEAPIDGFLLPRRGGDKDGARQLLKYLATPAAEEAYIAGDPNNIAVNSAADTSKYGPLQQKAVQLVSSAKHVSQFLDRDTRPDFASTVMIPAIQQFINNPKDVDGLVNDIERQKKSIFATEG
ncbi:ABC transporter substrate-binding protein [Streptacidiphilus griseoplanus]|uniref:ABC transporter substrate-binding protein n=1 Tax=Peterkaempfera griseoplana TaxID=66896 RepID=UPI0006E17596|nr:ABC transporter substrate-binding protein [Peterkaempfera griseoplana]